MAPAKLKLMRLAANHSYMELRNQHKSYWVKQADRIGNDQHFGLQK